ncbi:MAG: large conductance mechanosensitive channel protein MscL [Bdellovibrionales bacterium]
MFNEFKSFIARGNVIDLAVGIIMGAAFTAIVTSLVSDVIMPPIGWAMGGLDFSNYYWNPADPLAANTMSLDDARKAGLPVVAYGAFINAIIKFAIVAFAVFFLVRAVTRLQKKLNLTKDKDAVLTPDQQLLTEIRDLLKK